jgi:hypothetical protein
MASVGSAARALETRWRRNRATFRLMRRSVRVGRGIYYYKPRWDDVADYERLLGSVEKLKVAFPKIWSLVIKSEPEPFWSGESSGLPLLLRELKTSKKQRDILIDALQSLALSELRKRTEAQLITVVVMCVLRAARKRGPSGTELALLAIVTGFEQPTSDPHAHRQRPDTWDNCIKTCGPWVEWLMDPTPREVRIFPDDFPEHQIVSADPAGTPVKWPGLFSPGPDELSGRAAITAVPKCARLKKG